MRMLLLFGILAGAMSAQDFHGVSVDDRVAQVSVRGIMRQVHKPVIVNRSNKPVIGYDLNRETSTGNFVKPVLDLDWMAKGTPILPGEERSALGLSIAFGTGNEGQVTGYSLISVLFSDGTFIGPDERLPYFADRIAQWRNLARYTQSLPEKYRPMEEDRRSLVERGEVSMRSTMAHMLLGIRDSRGEAEVEAALGRLAALPDVVKGENQ